MNQYQLQLAIMKTQQQLHGQQQDDDFQEFGDEEQPYLDNSRPKERKYAILIALVVVFILAGVILLVLGIASTLGQSPQVHINYMEQAYYPSDRVQERPREVKQMRAKPAIEAMVKEVKIYQKNSMYFVEVQSSNQAHRSYQHTMRNIQYDNSKIALSKYAGRALSKDSGLTYAHYLRTLNYLQLAAFPINDFSYERIKLFNQERQQLAEHYDLNPSSPSASICIVMELTHSGLQTGSYYYALKSLFEQDYNNFKVVIINSPEMKMLDDINKMVSLFPDVNVTILDKIATRQPIGSAFYSQSVVHKYCKGNNLTILLRDTGELIGRQVFKVINKVYQQFKPPIIFTNYLLESINPLRQKLEPFRYKAIIYPPNLANDREEAYKTKYLKIYSTNFLLRVSDKAFQNNQGEWSDGLMEASLQFAMMEVGCGKYYLLEEIMYKATKYDMENALQVLDARSHAKMLCFQQMPYSESQTKQNEAEQKMPIKDLHFLDFDDIRNLTESQIVNLKFKFRQIHSNRAIINSKFYSIIDNVNRVNKSNIAIDSINPASKIKEQQLEDIAQKLSYSLRPSIYIDEMKKTPISLEEMDPVKIETRNVKGPSIDKTIKVKDSIQQGNPTFTEEIIQFCVFLFTSNHYSNLDFLYTIQSIITQKYGKFRLIILDNKSNDLTAEVIKYHLTKVTPSQRNLVTLRQTSKNIQRSELLYRAIKQFSQPNQVAIIIESGQEFLDKTVFKKLNDYYKKTQALAVYSSSIYLSQNIMYVGPAQPPNTDIIKGKTYRKYPLYFQKLRSFQSILFSKIISTDFANEKGDWISEGQNQILAYAIEELACGNIAYLSQLLLRLPSKPINRPLTASLELGGFKYECFEPSQLKINP